MNIHSIQLTVLFDDPFWVGFFEATHSGEYSVAKKIFGAEPTNAELYHFILKGYDRLQFSLPTTDDVQFQQTFKKLNPKRRQREAQKALNNKSTVTKAQQAIKTMQENTKVERKKQSKLRRDDDKIRKFQLKQLKKKAKLKGH